MTLCSIEIVVNTALSLQISFADQGNDGGPVNKPASFEAPKPGEPTLISKSTCTLSICLASIYMIS